MSHTTAYCSEAISILSKIDHQIIEQMVDELAALRSRQGRLFIVGVGGSAANASHAVNDFRKLTGIETYSPFDNVSELTARTNDEGWETVVEAWLKVSHANSNDALLVLSVGGGNQEKNVSVNLIRGIDHARGCGMRILGVVGRDGGYTKKAGDCVLVIPTVNDRHITPHAESFQSVALHCITCHPKLQINAYKWGAAEPASQQKPTVDALRVKIFADGADIQGMLEMSKQSYIQGFTTNPTLMKKAGIGDYESFAKNVLAAITDRPVSFEVLSDDFATMEQQARLIASWGRNVYVKIPVSNTRGEFAGPLISRLSAAGIQVNVTAVMTSQQIQAVAACLATSTPSCLSIFAGRIADTGRDPLPLVKEAIEAVKGKACEVIWASPRELLNVFQANDLGCHIITVTNDLLAKLNNVGKNLEEYSLDTVKMFYNDATKAGLSLKSDKSATEVELTAATHSTQNVLNEVEELREMLRQLTQRMTTLDGRLAAVNAQRFTHQ